MVLAAGSGGACYYYWSQSSDQDSRRSPVVITQDPRSPFRVEELPLIPVKKGKELTTRVMDGVTGGVLQTPDGITVTFPNGSWEGERVVSIREATAPAPPLQWGMVGMGEVASKPMRTLYFDAGEDKGLFAKEATVSVPLGSNSGQAIVPMISVDGRTWRFVDYGIKDGNLVFSTRHFSPVSFLQISANPWYLAVLGTAAVAFVVVYRADELPTVFRKDAPFVGIPGIDSGPFDLYWSRTLAGVDPKTGFLDEPGYKRKMEEIANRYKGLGGCSSWGGAQACREEINQARRNYLMPPSVRAAEAALQFARKFIESRKFQSPAFHLPVYIVPSMGGKHRDRLSLQSLSRPPLHGSCCHILKECSLHHNPPRTDAPLSVGVCLLRQK
jgi:hypothetical protein